MNSSKRNRLILLSQPPPPMLLSSSADARMPNGQRDRIGANRRSRSTSPASCLRGTFSWKAIVPQPKANVRCYLVITADELKAPLPQGSSHSCERRSNMAGSIASDRSFRLIMTRRPRARRFNSALTRRENRPLASRIKPNPANAKLHPTVIILTTPTAKNRSPNATLAHSDQTYRAVESRNR